MPRRAAAPERGSGIWLYGTHAVLAALANPARRCRRLLATAEAGHVFANSWAGRLPAGLAPEIVERRRLEQVLPADAVHQGLALSVEPLAKLDIGDACAPRPEMPTRGIALVLDRVTDPHNVGAILRSAAAFGARAVILTDRHAPNATGALAKAASGALELVPLVRVVNLSRALEQLAELGYWRIGLDAAAAVSLAETARRAGDVALVLGAEGEGLRRLTAENCDVLARLPILAVMPSLNVSNAAAVALYELARAG